MCKCDALIALLECVLCFLKFLIVRMRCLRLCGEKSWDERSPLIVDEDAPASSTQLGRGWDLREVPNRPSV